MKKVILKILLGSLCLSAFVGIIIILFGSSGYIENKILATTLVIFGYSIPGLCSSVIYEKEGLKYFSIFGMGLALFSCLYILCFVWGILDFGFTVFQLRLLGTVNILCWSSGHISLLSLISNKNDIVFNSKSFTILFSLIVDIMILIPIWNIFTPQSFYYRLLAAAIILTVLGTIVTPILNKIYKNIESDTNSVPANSADNQDIEICDFRQENKNTTNNKKSLYKKLIVIVPIFIVVFLGVVIYYLNRPSSVKNYSNIDDINHTINLKELLDDNPSYSLYDTSNYYFIYNDKIYYYALDLNSNYMDKLYSYDLDGSNEKILAETDELRYAKFYFVYNNEAYYYTTYYSDNKKINLTTGEITSLKDNESYIPKSLQNGTVNSFVDNAVAGNSYSTFKKIDLNTNKTLYDITTKYSMSGNEYFFDYENGNIYYLEDFYSKHPTIYKNNEIIYEFLNYDRYSFDELKFIACNDNYVYFKRNNYIYKLNVNTKSIEKEINYNLGDVHRISSGNNTDNYFYISNKIYSFDLETDSFSLILRDVLNEPEEVYHIDNKLIFTENVNNLKYYTSYDNLGSVTIYNLDNNFDTKKYLGIRKVSFDDKFMYLVINSDTNYYIEKINLYD